MTDKMTDKMMDKQLIAIVGTGNVGSHLAKAFRQANSGAIEIASGSARNLNWLAELPRRPDLILICVSDSAIIDVAQKLSALQWPHHDGAPRSIIAHTSGSLPIEALSKAVAHSQSKAELEVSALKEGEAEHKEERPKLNEGKPELAETEAATNFDVGVFYPLQTFTKDVEMDYSAIPFLIEGGSTESEERLMNFARMISKNVERADSEIRGRYHLAAVIACNFSNYLYAESERFLEENGNLKFSMLLPLIRQTVEKLSHTRPEAAQTGPAIRGDQTTISRHLSLLQSDPPLQALYSLLTERIITLAGDFRKNNIYE